MFERFKSHRPRGAKPARSATQPSAEASGTRPGQRRVGPADLARAEAEAARASAPDAPEGEDAAAGEGAAAGDGAAPEATARATELGGPDGPEPTRYGDWERKGICYDF